MTVIYSILLVFWAFVANLFKKHINILCILLINSYCLGLIDRDNFGIFNLFDINAICLVVYIYYILANFSFKRLRYSYFAKYFIFLLFFYVYGVFYPFFDGNSSLFYSLKEGKEYIHYLSFFATYLCVRKNSDIDWGWCYIMYLAFYYGVLEIAFTLGLYKLDIIHYLYRIDPVLGIVKVYQPIFAIVFLALFYFIWEAVILQKRLYFQIIFLFLTALLTAFRSYILGSFIAFAGALLFMFRGKYLRRFIAVYIAIIFIGIFSISITFSGSISDRLSDNFDKYIFSGIKELVTQKGGSLEGREAVNKFRWKYYKAHPWSGYGFIDKYSKLGKEIYRREKAELSMIDTGYLDILNKFGLIGAIIFFCVFIRISFLLIKIVKKTEDNDIKVQGAALFCFVVVLVASQVTHAGLTFSFGIVPLSIGLGLFDSRCIEYINSQNAKLAVKK
jgi:O-antigen ligase